MIRCLEIDLPDITSHHSEGFFFTVGAYVCVCVEYIYAKLYFDNNH